MNHPFKTHIFLSEFLSAANLKMVIRIGTEACKKSEINEGEDEEDETELLNSWWTNDNCKSLDLFDHLGNWRSFGIGTGCEGCSLLLLFTFWFSDKLRGCAFPECWFHLCIMYAPWQNSYYGFFSFLFCVFVILHTLLQW